MSKRRYLDDISTINIISSDVSKIDNSKYLNYDDVINNNYRHSLKTGGGISSLIPSMYFLFNKKAGDKYVKDYANKGSMYGYPSIVSAPVYALSPYINYNNIPSPHDPKRYGDDGEKTRRAIFSRYFNLNDDDLDFNPNDYIVESQYRPTIETNKDSKYYTLKNKEDFVNRFSDAAGPFKVDKGTDDKGNYYSVYDNWDLDPFGHLFKTYGDTESRNKSLGNRPPIELYDRVYYDEDPKAYNELQRLYIKNKREENNKKRSLKSNGGIYIKPSHRGRFTALKERTGHSTTWFKENGTPAQKKMATFALNAAKWNH